MAQLSLINLSEEHLKKARLASSGRSATTIFGGRDHRLRQTLIAICAGSGLDDHESPGEATLQVLKGNIVLSTQLESWSINEGEIIDIPDITHAVHALKDSVFLLSVSKRFVHDSSEKPHG